MTSYSFCEYPQQNMDVPWPFPKLPNASWSRKSRITIIAVASFSKLWAEWMNNVKVYNAEIIHDALDNRPAGQPLVTVSNHQSCFDDPVLWGTLKWRHRHRMRWTPTASDICFTKPLHSAFFSLGQCVPTVRGQGVYQRAMEFLLDRLNQGDWVHVFPEGKVNMTHEFMRLKWGVGRLIADCIKVPMVIPMWHLGMDSVLPNEAPYIPRVGKRVTLLYGNPIDLTDLVRKLKDAKASPMEQRKAITDRIQEEFQVMKNLAEQIHFGSSKS